MNYSHVSYNGYLYQMLGQKSTILKLANIWNLFKEKIHKFNENIKMSCFYYLSLFLRYNISTGEYDGFDPANINSDLNSENRNSASKLNVAEA